LPTLLVHRIGENWCQMSELAMKSQHRNFSLPDLIIAATAELAGLTVLHYDEAYDRIAKITGQPVEWVVPKGSL